jgi:hypothetical protein
VSVCPTSGVPEIVGGEAVAGGASVGLRRASGVTARMPGVRASFRICFPVSSAETPLIEANRRLRPFALPGLASTSPATERATAALPLPGEPWTMTSKDESGRAWA